MRLYSFGIQNFRSIIDTGEIKISENDNITIFAGQNESGKTSILEALDFFENGPKEDFEDQQRRLGSFPEVKCKFFLNDSELKQIEDIAGKEVSGHIKKNRVTYKRGNTDSDNFTSITFVYDPLLKDLCNAQVTSNAEGNQIPYTIEQLTELVKPLRPKMIFYSSFGESILPPKITNAQLGSNQAVTDFEKVFNVNFKSLLSNNDRSRTQKFEDLNTRASENLNEYWKQKIDETSQYKYKVDAIPQMAQPEESYVTFYIDRGDNHPLSIGQKSTGFRWFSSFNLRLRAHQASYSEPGKFILLIDEPGQGLHEEAQKNVMRVLNEMSSSGWQILYSTHLPQLLGGEDADLSRIKLVIPSLQEGTKIKNIPQATTEQGFMDALSPLRTAIGQITLDINSFLNGKKTVIVEGITDYYYFKAFLLLLGKHDSFAFIPPVGVNQTPNIYSILLGWGISPLIIVDGDRQGQTEFNKIKKGFFENSEEKTKEVVYINAGCDGIEDTFGDDDFKLFAEEILSETEIQSTEKNSIKSRPKKELIGRTFFDKVKNGSISIASLADATKSKIEAVFAFIEAERQNEI